MYICTIFMFSGRFVDQNLEMIDMLAKCWLKFSSIYGNNAINISNM